MEYPDRLEAAHIGHEDIVDRQIEGRIVECDETTGATVDDRNFESMALEPGANDETDMCVVVYSRRPIEIADPDSLSKTSCESYTTVKPQYERLVRPRGPA